MSDLRLFSYGDHSVRTLPATDDRPELFAATDLCALLDHRNVSEAVRTHLDADEWMRVDPVSAGGTDSRFDLDAVDPDLRPAQQRGLRSRPVTILMVTESGAWALLFGSEAPRAREVRRWLARDVLPALRARGAYALPDVNARLVATLTAAHAAIATVGESDTRHAEDVLRAEGPADLEERERKLAEVCALDATRRMVAAELARWSDALPAGTPVPMPESVVALAEHLRVTTKRGGRPAPVLPAGVRPVGDHEVW